MGMELMYVACGAMVLMFILILISCRLSIGPYKEMIKTLNDRIEDLEKRLAKAESKPKGKTEQKKDED